MLTLLESVAQFTEDAQVRFAVLACYFGQGLSSSVQTTATGVLEIQQLGHLYPIPKTYIELAVMTARYHLLCHRALELDANTLLSLLEKTDAFRRIERFKQFLEACEAEFRACSTLTIPAYPQKKRLLDALVAAQSVSAQFLIKQGLKKESLGKKLQLIVCDRDPHRAARCAQDFKATVVPPEAIYQVEGDIFAPCALGGILNESTLAQLNVAVIAGAANNQLAEPQHAQTLDEKGILYVPDYVINVGGLIYAYAEYCQTIDIKAITAQVNTIYDTVLELLQRATREKKRPEEIADNMAEERLHR
ncbi:Glu/Leu/Phe/Val dehydrogenase [Rickettsiella massiliensis]|uniref:Glu/Leu/Phe/Val dehydrogenase n=1 Tax=Rickettsiella massiliensis TaxID=676517 RepID=UPI00029A9250|nr:Glu/Leu/Phe/Val dehydrogenase [Rickettsiella massiliensis]